jgi:hypothetical protein
MKERTFQDATAAAAAECASLEAPRRADLQYFAASYSQFKLRMLCNMLKILGEIILYESGVRLRFLALML